MALLSTGLQFLGHRSDTAKARKTMDTGLVHHGVPAYLPSFASTKLYCLVTVGVGYMTAGWLFWCCCFNAMPPRSDEGSQLLTWMRGRITSQHRSAQWWRLSTTDLNARQNHIATSFHAVMKALNYWPECAAESHRSIVPREAARQWSRPCRSTQNLRQHVSVSIKSFNY